MNDPLDIRDYWNLPPDEQYALIQRLRGPQPSVLRFDKGVEARGFYDDPEHKAAEARTLLELRGDYENMDTRSDDDCIEACELEGYEWNTHTGSWVMGGA